MESELRPTSEPTPSRRDADPDAAGLPPHIVLPDAKAYRRDQLWGLVVSNTVGLLVLAILWWLFGSQTRLIAVCVFALAATLVLNLFRWAVAAVAARKKSP